MGTTPLFCVVGLIAAVLVTVGCETDCRHASRACAAGFNCEPSGTGGWECVRSGEAAAPAPGSFANLGTQLLPLCPAHSLCVEGAIECRCDATGRLVQRTLDLDGDNRGDEQATYRYDSEGHLGTVAVDERMDGQVDVRHRYTYDEQGNPAVWEVRRSTAALSPGDTRRVVYVYDGNGSLLAEKVDLGMDDIIDGLCTYDPPCPPPIPNPTCKPACKELNVGRPGSGGRVQPP